MTTNAPAPATDIKAAQPGDHIRSTMVRSEEFRAIFADSFIALGQPGTVTLSVSRLEPREIVTEAVVQAVHGQMAELQIVGITANPVVVEEAHIRASKEAWVDGAIAILQNVLLDNPELVRRKFQEAEALRQGLTSNG